MRLLALIALLIPLTTGAANKTLNLYLWANEVPASLIKKFENETGIKVNISSYDSNEILYTKLKTAKNLGFDIVSPSTYFVQKMQENNLLLKFNKQKIPNWKNLANDFLNQAYDPNNDYSMPLIWGATGIFVNKRYIEPTTVTHWQNLWEPRFNDRLLLLDDMREVFAMALIKCGYSANDENPAHIRQAYHALKALRPNIKVYNSTAMITLVADEDVTVGMAWNGDVSRTRRDNTNVIFQYPEDGFVLWVDSLVIPKTAPHPDAAYAFINFLLEPENSAEVITKGLFPVPNKHVQALLPANLSKNPALFPPQSVLKRGEILTSLAPATIQLMEKYWELLRIS